MARTIDTKAVQPVEVYDLERVKGQVESYLKDAQSDLSQARSNMIHDLSINACGAISRFGITIVNTEMRFALCERACRLVNSATTAVECLSAVQDFYDTLQDDLFCIRIPASTSIFSNAVEGMTIQAKGEFIRRELRTLLRIANLAVAAEGAK